MRQVVIENPIINSPFEEPRRHFKFDDQGITNEIDSSRRISCYFIPIAQPKKKANQKQLSFDDWNQTRVEENKTIKLGQAKIAITNSHAFLRREKIRAGKLTKDILRDGPVSPFTESDGEMVRRVCRGLGAKKNVIVINDEAHHCYRHRVGDDSEKLSGDQRKEAEREAEKARVWIGGLEAIQQKLGIKAAYDLSATPFFLRGSGYGEGKLFPWGVSDFSLIDAIECGIVKVPRVPVSDDSMVGDQPTYRDLWLRIRDDLPKKGRKTDAVSGGPKLPVALEGAIQSLYANYAKCYARWEANTEARENGITPPVFIVVCNNTNVSKMVCDYVPDFIVRIDDGHGADDLLNLIVEVTGEKDRTRKPRSPRPRRSGCRRSITPPLGADGDSLKSAIRGMRKTRFGRRLGKHD